jgi:hypothetical protein
MDWLEDFNSILAIHILPASWMARILGARIFSRSNSSLVFCLVTPRFAGAAGKKTSEL